MLEFGRRPRVWLMPFVVLLGIILLGSCQRRESVEEVEGFLVGQCVSVRDVGEDDAAPVARVPCVSPGATSVNHANTYRIVLATTLDLPVTTRLGANELALLYCGSPEIVPGDSLFVFPTEASFAHGFKQFLCLVTEQFEVDVRP